MTREAHSPHPLIDFDWIREAAGIADLSPSDCLAYQDTVGPNALFDPVYYRDTYGTLIPSGMTCLEHFCRQRRDGPLNPNGLFSMQQWHETIGHRLESPQWRTVLFETLGREARFSREEMARYREGKVVLSDQVIGPSPRAGQEIVLFVHYDANDEVAPYVTDYMDALREQGVCFLFLTNSARLTPAAWEQLKGRVWRVVCSHNKAYDWGLYHVGVRLLERGGFTGHPLILANDSVVGTINSLDPLFVRARSGEAEVTGAIDSRIHAWHLQSFFLYCTASLVGSAAWRDFWAAWRPHHDKWCVINSHEFGFSRWMQGRGVTMKAAWSYDDVLKAVDIEHANEWRRALIEHKRDVNPTHELWDVMLECGFPFLKRSVFTMPLASENLTHMTNVISRIARRSHGHSHNMGDRS